jgi:hypothetical protein
VETVRQDMEQEAADELVRCERHDALPLRTIAAVVFVAEGDTGLIERKQALVGDGDPVGVAREIGEHGLRAGERWPGINHEPPLPDRSKMTQEQAVVGETGLGAEESKSSGPLRSLRPLPCSTRISIRSLSISSALRSRGSAPGGVRGSAPIVLCLNGKWPTANGRGAGL